MFYDGIDDIFLLPASPFETQKFLDIPGAPSFPVIDFMPCGSRITCNPPPTDTDRDWLVFVDPSKWDEFFRELESNMWVIGGSSIPNEENTIPETDRFNSFTLGEDNIIATCSADFYKKFAAATHVAKRLNVLSKRDRVALFQAVLYGQIVNN